MNKFEKTLNSPFSKFMNFVYKIMVVNLLFLFTSAIGLVFFTIAPAMIAMLTCMKAINEQKDFPIVKSFFHIFRTEYRKSMLFFVIYLVVFTVLGLSFYYYMQSADTVFNTVGLVVLGLLLILQIGSFIHMLLISIYTPKIKLRSKFKYSYIMLVYRPIQTVLLLVVNVLMLIFSYIFITFSFMFTFAFMGYYNISLTKGTYIQISKDHEPLDVLSF